MYCGSSVMVEKRKPSLFIALQAALSETRWAHYLKLYFGLVISVRTQLQCLNREKHASQTSVDCPQHMNNNNVNSSYWKDRVIFYRSPMISSVSLVSSRRLRVTTGRRKMSNYFLHPKLSPDISHNTATSTTRYTPNPLKIWDFEICQYWKQD